MPNRAVLGVLAGVCVLAVAAVTAGRTYLTERRDFPASVPQAPSVISVELVRLDPGERACLDNVVMDTHSEQARFQVSTYGRRSIPLRLELRGDGYAAAAPVPASRYTDEAMVKVAVPAPQRDVLVRACIASAGRRPVALMASTPGESSASRITVEGRPVATNPWLAFYEARPTTVAHRAGTMVERMGVFRPPFIGPWLIWPLAALFILGVPAGVLAAYGRALRDDDEP